MRLPVSFLLHLELNSTRNGRVWPVAENLVNDLKVFILVGVVLMLVVLEVHVLPHDMRNTVLQLCLAPGFEMRGTRLDDKGAWINPLGNLTGGIPSLRSTSAQRPGSFNSKMALNFEKGDWALRCLVLLLSMLLFKTILHRFGGVFGLLECLHRGPWRDRWCTRETKDAICPW